MKFVFIIAAEHHLFQVYAALQHFKITDNANTLLIIMDMGQDTYIERIKESNQFGSVVVFKNWVFKDLFLDPQKSKTFIKFCTSLEKATTDYALFSSQYDSDPDLLFLSIVKPKRHYLMDEGTASFSVVNKRSFKDKRDFIFLIKSTIYRHKILLPKKLIYFTKYNIEAGIDDRIERYEVNQINNPLSHIISNEAIFLGTSITECDMMDVDTYLVLLSNIYTNIKENKCYYYPHRKESIEKLQRIEHIGFIINKIDEPFESMFEKQTECPALFCSFFTTGVLDNISKSNLTIPQLRIYSFDMDLLKFHKEIYKEIYKEMLTNSRLEFIDI